MFASNDFNCFVFSRKRRISSPTSRVKGSVVGNINATRCAMTLDQEWGEIYGPQSFRFIMKQKGTAGNAEDFDAPTLNFDRWTNMVLKRWAVRDEEMHFVRMIFLFWRRNRVHSGLWLRVFDCSRHVFIVDEYVLCASCLQTNALNYLVYGVECTKP